MQKIIQSLILFLFPIVFFIACNDDEGNTPVTPEEVEGITSLFYTLIPQGSGSPAILSYRDLDGDGGDAPEITGGILSANETYTGTVELLNEMESPAVNISEAVEEMDEAYQFFFQSTVSGLTIAYNDLDSDGNPIGLSSTLTTGAAGTGTITIILRHQPNKNGEGVADGNIANAGGETDIEVTFEVEVQE